MAFLLSLEQVEDILNTFDLFGQDKGFRDAISICAAALSSPFVIEDADLSRQWKFCKAKALHLRFRQDEDTDDHEEAVRILEELLSLPGPPSPFQIRILYMLGRTLQVGPSGPYTFKDRERALVYFERALSQAQDFPPEDVPYLPELKILWAGVTAELVLRRSPGDLDKALECIHSVIEELDDSDPRKVYAYNSLGILCERRWRLNGESSTEDLEKSRDAFLKGFTVGEGKRLRAVSLMRLSNVSLELFKAGGSIDLLRDAVNYGELASGSSSYTYPNTYADCLTALAVIYTHLFEAEGDLNDLDSAVRLQRDAMRMRKTKDPYNYHTLAIALGDRFRETGRRIDLDDAIEAGQTVIDITDAEHPFIVFPMAHIGRAYCLRYIHENDEADYERCKSHLTNVIRLCKDGDGFHKSLLGSCWEILSQLEEARFLSKSDPSSLDAAIGYIRDSISGWPDGHRELPPRYSALGEYLASRYLVQQHPADLVASIDIHELAIRTDEGTSSDRHLYLYRYCKALRLRYESAHDVDDFDSAVVAIEEAIQLAQKSSHARLPLYMSEQAACFEARFLYRGVRQDLLVALDQYRMAAETAQGTTDHRFQAAAKGAYLAHRNQELDKATALYSYGISLLPRLAWLGHTLTNRHAKLTSTLGQFVNDAVASALASGNTEQAVELFEAGRSILWRSVLQLRADLRGVQTATPELADELWSVGQALEHEDAAIADVSEKQSEQRGRRRRRMAERWDVLVERVRAVPGFEDFLRPLSYSRLCKAAIAGPLVLLNASRLRTDSIIVEPDGSLRCIPLPDLAFETVVQMSYMLSMALKTARDQAGCQYLERTLLSIARRLWDGGLSSVAGALLGYDSFRERRLCRIWLVTSGLFSVLPIHCAGPYHMEERGIPDLFISSYTSTIGTLLNARDRPGRAACRPGLSRRILAVAQTTVPDSCLPDLPHASLEMQVLATSAFAGEADFLMDGEASSQTVKTHLPNYSWTHFCCHGHYEPTRPLHSAFMFKDGSLTLTNVVEMRLSNADFAYLSACHTARHSPVLPDECIHLAASLQVAGFRGVLGSAWGVADRDGPALAYEFYGSLGKQGSLDAVNAAEALHHAVGTFRKKGIPMHRWAPFVHIGV